MSDNKLQKETAIPSEQQFKTPQKIIDDIIKIFADNVLSISDAEYVLYEISKKLHQQPVITIGEDVKRIYRMRNMGEVN